MLCWSILHCLNAAGEPAENCLRVTSSQPNSPQRPFGHACRQQFDPDKYGFDVELLVLCIAAWIGFPMIDRSTAT